MALTNKQRERIEKLEFAKGGGFSDFITNKHKLQPADSKFLFVGLGGKGSSVVASIKTGVYKKIICNHDKKRPENFEYLVIDTDKRNLEELERGAFGEVGLSGSPSDLETCQLYDDIAAKRLSPDRRSEIPEYVEEWLSPTMNQELQGEGAGGNRQAGRYLLFGENAFTTVKNALTLKLKNLHGLINNPESQKLIVYIFAGVGGGTGSGTIIDIPYIIREICRKNSWSVKIYSYIFLPDTYSDEARNQTHVKYNSYAALKEIDTLMNIGQMGGAAHFQAKYEPDFSVDSVSRIFDSCVLVSGQKNNGMVAEPDKFTKRVVVDNIINLVTKNETSNGFLVNSFLDNSPAMIQNAVGTLSDARVPKNAYYQYMVIGTGEMVLPIEQIFAYISHGTMGLLWTGWSHHAQQKDVESLLAKLTMKPQELSSAIIGKSKVPLMQYTKGIGGRADKTDVINDTLFNTIKQYWLGQNVALYDAWDEAKNFCLEFVIGQLKENYYSIFKDNEKGIFFLKELLSFRVIEGHGINGMWQRISEEYMDSVSGLIAGQNQMQNQMNQRMREIKEKLDSPFCIKGGLIEEYRELCVAKLVSDNMIYMYDIVRSCLKEILAFIEKKSDELQAYIDIFTYMKEIVDRNYRSVMNGSMPRVAYAGTLIDFSKTHDGATQKIIKYMDSMLGTKTPQGLATALANRIIQKEEQWIHSEEKFNPMKVFVDFLEEQYKDLQNLTIEEFIRLKYGTAGFNQGMQAICQELKNRADVIFPADTIISLYSLASKKYVVVPAGALNISANMAAFATANSATIAYSNDMNSMFWYNIVIGVPMFLLKDIGEYENAYEKNNIAGMHCKENANVNWKEWPTLSNQTLWSSPDKNMREKRYAMNVAADVKQYLACGLIQKEEGTELYQAYCAPENNSAITKESIVTWCKETYMEEPDYDEDGNIEAGKSFVNRIIASHSFDNYLVNLPDVYMNVTEENVYKLVRMNVFLYHRLQSTYKIYMECKEMIEKENVLRKKENAKVISMQRFYDYVRTGIVQITDDAVLLEQRDGEQEEIMYFDDYNTLENKFYLYIAFQNFMEKFDEEELEEVDEYRKELSSNRSEEARTKYRRLSEGFIKECTDMRDSLKKLETKKLLEKSGQAAMIAVYTEFFDTFISMKKGR